MIHLYTASTPNGHKISCLLEALKMPYEVHSVNLGEGDQHKADFVKISPNGRIPAIVDTDNDLSIFESGAIMLYLADKAGELIPKDVVGRAKVTEWLMFQMGGIGPMMGQANVFSIAMHCSSGWMYRVKYVEVGNESTHYGLE